MTLQRLPVEDILDELRQSLRERDEVVLIAPPGAGKTTLIPLALRHEPWLAGRKILMLEPRRIATKSAANRMASMIKESPGQTVGYRMRLDTRVGKATTIEVITEGILTRMLQQDPALESVGLVIFDEFHERHLDSDLALALCLKGRELFRSDTDSNPGPLKILVMSATLDSDAIAPMLGDARIVRSEGRAYPVTVNYARASQAEDRIVDRMVAMIKQALGENPHSSLLAFLPGQGEIRQTAVTLSSWLASEHIRGIHLRPLYGDLSIEDQQSAIAPLAGKAFNDRKIVLATNIAETSLTIEGIDVVIDSGLAREPRFDPATGMTGLHTVKISNASSVQRAGRAGRLRPGQCYRLWSAAQQQLLSPHSPAEILKADLAPVALQLLQWGVDDPAQLSWLDPPPRGAWQQAIDLLKSLGAIEIKNNSLVLSAHGQAMASLPVHPRLAHLLICGKAAGFVDRAVHLACLLSNRDPFSRENPDINHRIDLLTGETLCAREHQGWLRRNQLQARQFRQLLVNSGSQVRAPQHLLKIDQVTGYLLACAYPDRIARRRHSGTYQLANGRSARFFGQSYLSTRPWLAVAEVSHVTGGRGDLIGSAADLDDDLFSTVLSDLVSQETIAEWDNKTSRFVAEDRQILGALVLQSTPLSQVPVAAKKSALIQYLQKEGLRLLPWNPGLIQWCARVSLVASIEKDKNWPVLSEDNLLASADSWLAPYLDNVNLLQDFKKLDLKAILDARLTQEQHRRLNLLVPTHIRVASGSSIVINYSESPPVLAVKLQEMFGCEQTPTVVAGRVPLLVHLLSPAGRPLQITQDLAGFWRSSYHEVKKEMKGRYPKHPWPDDPLIAIATRRTKKS